MSKIFIKDREIGGDAPCFIIAEVGINHNRDLELAKNMIRAAADAGVDAVKFQFIKTERFYVRNAGMFKADTVGEVDLYPELEKLDLPIEWIDEFRKCCEENNVIFFASVFDEICADMIDPYMDAYKIASYELTHIPLIKHVARKGKPIIISIGGAANIAEVREAIDAIKGQGNHNIAVMQCIAQYPAKIENANVKTLETLRKEFPDVVIGYSDHSLDPVAVPVAAVAKGAKLIEKHFTLDRNLPGLDHKMSLVPYELKQMVQAIRSAEAQLEKGKSIKISKEILGTGRVRPTADEQRIMDFTRRTLFAIKPIRKGEAFTRENIAVLRPGKRDAKLGLHPRDFETLLGKKAGNRYKPTDIISEVKK